MEITRVVVAPNLTAGRVKIDWFHWSVRELVYVVRSLNFGQAVHRAKTCKFLLCCTKCNVNENSADELRCSHFRKDVEAVRKSTHYTAR